MSEPHPSGLNRRARRARIRHHSLFTRNSIWLNWLHLPLADEGVALRVERLRKRRGKSKTWASKRYHRDLRRFKGHSKEEAARMQEILEEMQKNMLGQEESEDE